MLRNLVLLIGGCLTVSAQETPNLFNSAPPDVDKALRERIAGFYQAYVDGKFRASEQYVCEDTRDQHYNQEKAKIGGFEVIKVNWDDGFKSASVVTTVQTTIQMRGQAIPASAPMATNWKLEEGKWCYFVDLVKIGRQSPMGTMKAGPGNREGMKIDDMLKNPNIILNQVKVSQEKFLLKSWEKSSDAIVVTNGLQGSITLAFQTDTIPGLTHKVERTELGPGETSRIELFYTPPNPSAKPTLKARLLIEPINRTILVPVVFDIPEEIKKQLPKL